MKKVLIAMVTLLVNTAGASPAEDVIRERLRGAGITAPEAIRLPESVSVALSEPLLAMSARAAGESVWVKWKCRHSTACKPFFAGLRFPNSKEAATAARMLGAEVTRRRDGPIAIRAGAVVELRLLGKNARVHMLVKALESRRSGERIRVRGLDMKIHSAIVQSPKLVEAAW
jgi:hypothetical protein